MNTYVQQLEVCQSDLAAAEKIAGRSEQPVRLAAWTNVASVVLNLDEAITRE